MGGPQGPSVSRSPGVTPQNRPGRPMGPSTPLCSPQSFLLFVLFRMSRNKFSDWFLCKSVLWGIVCNFEPFKFRAFSCFVWDPHWNCLAVFGTQRFFFSCSGTLSFLLSSLSERYRSRLAGTHTHTHTLEERHFLPVRRLPLPFFVVSFSSVFICLFLLPFGFLSAILRVPLSIPRFLVFSGLPPDFWFSRDYLLLLRPFSDFTKVVLQLRFSFLSLTSSFFLVWRLHSTARKGRARLRTWHTPRSSYLPSARVRAEGRRRARPVGPGRNLKEAHFCFICSGMPQGHRDRALARRRRVLMSHGRSVFPRHLGPGLSPVFCKFRCFVAF